MKVLPCSTCGIDVSLTGKYAGRAKSTICEACQLRASPDLLPWALLNKRNRELIK